MMEQTSLLSWIILLPLIATVINGIGGAIPWKSTPRIPIVALLALIKNRTFIWRSQAKQNFHSSGFARAVFADKGVNRTAFNGEIDATVCPALTVPL